MNQLTIFEFLQRLALIVTLIACLYLVFQLKFVILILFIIMVVSYTLMPIVEWFERYKISRSITTFCILLIIVSAIIGIATGVYSALKIEITALITTAVETYNTLAQQFNLDLYTSSISPQDVLSQLGGMAGGSLSLGAQTAFNISSSVFGVLFTVLTSITILFYLVYQPDKITAFVVSLFPQRHQANGTRIIKRIEDQLSKWLQGQLIIMVFMGVLAYIGFLIIGVPYPLLLAILVGLLDIVPVIGPLMALIPTLLVTVAESPVQAGFVLVFFLILQNVESNILVPRIMSKTIGLDPLYVIIGLMIGSTLGGVLGALLAIPGSVIVKILYEEWQATRPHAKKKSIEQ